MEERKGGGVRVGEVVHEDGGPFRHGCDGVLLDLRVGGEDAFGEALDHCSGEGEVLWADGAEMLVGFVLGGGPL